MENDALWARVIKSLYEPTGGLSSHQLSHHKGPWAAVIKASRDVYILSPDFQTSFQRVLGCGSSIGFRHDSWVGNNLLFTRFTRLYALETNKEALFADKIIWQNGTFLWQWTWRHARRGRAARELDEFLQLIQWVKPAFSTDDGWLWSWARDGNFSVKVLSSVLDNAVSEILQFSPIWSSLVPKKVNIFMWRARRCLLPCKLQLALRGLQIDNLYCPICNSAVEELDHALLACWPVRDVWSALSLWCGVNFIDVLEVSDLASQRTLKSVQAKHRPILEAMIMCSSWVIWKARNKFLMEGIRWSSMSIISEIQVLSHLWI